QLVGGKASAGESNVGENLAQRLVRARLVVVVRIGEVGGRIERHESSYLRGVSKAEEESNLLRKTQDTVVDKKLPRAAWHESEGRIEGKRLEQRTLVEVGALHHRHAVEIAAAKRVRQPLRQGRRARRRRSVYDAPCGNGGRHGGGWPR